MIAVIILLFSQLFLNLQASYIFRSNYTASQSSVNPSKIELTDFRRHRKDIHVLRRAPHECLHKLVFAIQQNNIDSIHSLLIDISDPNSKNYGKYKSRREIGELTRNDKAVDRTITFLASLGIRNVTVSAYGEYIFAVAPISLWERSFDTQFYELRQDGMKTTYMRALKFTLPTILKGHVIAACNSVQLHLPVTKSIVQSSLHRSIQHEHGNKNRLTRHRFRKLKASQDKAIAGSSSSPQNPPKGSVTPSLLNTLYSIEDNTGSPLASQAVYESLGQTVSNSDLAAFQNYFDIPLHAVDADVGGHVQEFCPNENECVEANLDVQYLMAVSQVTPTTYYYMDESISFTEFLASLAAMASPPLVFSISYSGNEEFYTEEEIQLFNIEAQKLGAQGVTLVVASGDDGAPSYVARDSPEFCAYRPQFPASSPYVLSVGGTQGPESGTAEVACQSQLGAVITSGGGFSRVNAMQDWQFRSVAGYFEQMRFTYPQPGFNSFGRGYPDVSALAYGYEMNVNGSFVAVSGTSASAPVVAGMISLVNAARLEAGLSPLGWINPALYRTYPQFTNDVTSGHNKCVASDELCCSQGFSAAAGWDPVTGLGSINFDKFKSLFTQLSSNHTQPGFAPPAPPAPVASPVGQQASTAPTARPTEAVGWIYLNTYASEASCSSSQGLFSSSWYPANKCLQTFTQGQPSGYLSYTCGAGFGGAQTIYQTLFELSDSTCSGTGIHTQELASTCASVNDIPSLRMFGPKPSILSHTVSFGCTTSAAPGMPDLPPGSYAVNDEYSNAQCSGASLGREVVMEGVCYSEYSSSGALTSLQLQWPDLLAYDNGQCEGTPRSVDPLSDTCEVAPTDDTAYSYYYSMYAYAYGATQTFTYSRWSRVVSASSVESKSSSPSQTGSDGAPLQAGAVAALAVVLFVLGMAVMGLIWLVSVKGNLCSSQACALSCPSLTSAGRAGFVPATTADHDGVTLMGVTPSSSSSRV